jgi:PEP-CTERM motif
MKKQTIISALSGFALLVSMQVVSAQGYVNINNYDSLAGVFNGSTATAAATGTTYFELMGGASAGSLSPVISANTGAGINALTDANGDGAGTGTFIDVGSGPVVGVANNGTAFLQLLIWTGAANFSGATSYFESAVWQQAIGSGPGTSPPTPQSPLPLNIDLTDAAVWGSVANLGSGNYGLVMAPVPEPTTLALGALGGLALMAFRRRKS